MNRIEPDWPVAASVGAFSTTRSGGVSRDEYAELNLGENCADDPDAVAENRTRLRHLLPDEPCWLTQVHGNRVIHLDEWRPGIEADAAWTDRPGQVAVIQTADCLPILIAHPRGRLVAAVHAGWRGLAAGVIGRTLEALPAAGSELVAWIGPGICAACYQVGGEVRDGLAGCAAAEAAFTPDGNRWRADLKALARAELVEHGVTVFDCRRCTVEEPETFYSYRRDGVTGRMGSAIWRQ